jgi:hypothetical protein
LAGTPAAPVITAQVSLSGGKVKDVSIQTLITTVNYETGAMRVDGYLQAGPQNSRLVWKGVVPVSLALIPFKFDLADRGLDLRVQSQNSTSLLPSFRRYIKRQQVDAVVTRVTHPNPLRMFAGPESCCSGDGIPWSCKQGNPSQEIR